MKKGMALVLAMIMVLSAANALAANFYLIPDSDTRQLTEEELWYWQYDALGYVLNEIFARHGYHFDPDGKYYAYFNEQDWYEESTRFSSNEKVLDQMSQIEWANEELVKHVREEMRKQDTLNPNGLPVPDVFDKPEVPAAYPNYR